jgi:hypothetical protein
MIGKVSVDKKRDRRYNISEFERNKAYNGQGCLLPVCVPTKIIRKDVFS